jgi:hypothetical protein
MLDNSGASEQTLRTLKTEMGAVNSARAARRDIRAASMMLDVVQVLTGNLAAEYRPRDGEIPWTAETCDNADEKFDNKSYTKLGIGTTLLGGNASASDCETLLQQMGRRPRWARHGAAGHGSRRASCRGRHGALRLGCACAAELQRPLRRQGGIRRELGGYRCEHDPAGAMLHHVNITAHVAWLRYHPG